MSVNLSTSVRYPNLYKHIRVKSKYMRVKIALARLISGMQKKEKESSI